MGLGIEKTQHFFMVFFTLKITEDLETSPFYPSTSGPDVA